MMGSSTGNPDKKSTKIAQGKRMEKTTRRKNNSTTYGNKTKFWQKNGD